MRTPLKLNITLFYLLNAKTGVLAHNTKIMMSPPPYCQNKWSHCHGQIYYDFLVIWYVSSITNDGFVVQVSMLSFSGSNTGPKNTKWPQK